MPKKKINEYNRLIILAMIPHIQSIAKQIWGEDIMFPDDFGMSVYNWQYHLSRVVTSKDPKKALDK